MKWCFLILSYNNAWLKETFSIVEFSYEIKQQVETFAYFVQTLNYNIGAYPVRLRSLVHLFLLFLTVHKFTYLSKFTYVSLNWNLSMAALAFANCRQNCNNWVIAEFPDSGRTTFGRIKIATAQKLHNERKRMASSLIWLFGHAFQQQHDTVV